MKSQNKDNIISEKYSNFGLQVWTESAFQKKVETEILIPAFKKGFINEFDNMLVPKDWFSFKDFFTEPDKMGVKFDNVGTKTPSVSLSYSKTLNKEEFGDLIVGKIDESSEFGGMIFNAEIKNYLNIVKISLPISESVDPILDAYHQIILEQNTANLITEARKKKAETPDDESRDDETDENPADENHDDETDGNPADENRDDKIDKTPGNENSDNDSNAASTQKKESSEERQKKIIEAANKLKDKAPDKFTLYIRFRMMIKFVDGSKTSRLRPKDYLNPNYIESFKGAILLGFKNDSNSSNYIKIRNNYV